MDPQAVAQCYMTETNVRMHARKRVKGFLAAEEEKRRRVLYLRLLIRFPRFPLRGDACFFVRLLKTGRREE